MTGAAPTDRLRDPGRRGRTLQVRLLGGFTVLHQGLEVALPASSQRLVALVAVHRHPIPRTVAAERLWPHLSQASALGSLRTAVARLRPTAPRLLTVRRDRLSLEETVAVDVRDSEALARRLIHGPSTEEPAIAAVEALTVPLLPEFDDDWAILERDRLQDLSLHALEAHAERLAEAGAFGESLAALHAALAVDPLRESTVFTLIEVHLAEGNRARALHCYRQFRERLRAALQVEPSAELRALLGPLV